MPSDGLTGAVFCIAWLLIQVQGVSRVPTGLEANLWYFCLKLHLQGPWASYFSNSVSYKTSQHLPFVISNPRCFLNICSTFWEKAMATHSSTLAWKIPWTEGPGGLQSMGSLGVGHDWATSRSLFTFMHWRRKWQPTPVFFPGESQGRESLVGCRPWGRTELDTTEVT